MMEMEFCNLLDIYADRSDIDYEEALHQWNLGNISTRDLLTAFLNDEGIFGYEDTLVEVIKILNAANAREGREW